MKNSKAFITSAIPTKNFVSVFMECSAALVGLWLPAAICFGLVQSSFVSANGVPEYKVPFVKNAKRTGVVFLTRLS